MIGLNKKNLNKVKEPKKDEKKDTSAKKDNTSESAGGELENMSALVQKALTEDGVPPTPANYQAYFEKFLEKKPLEARKNIDEMLESESANQDEQRAKIEGSVKESFTHVRDIMKVISGVYKNVKLMKQVSAAVKEKIANSKDPLVSIKITENFQQDLDKLTEVFEKQLESLKTKYEQTTQIIKEVETKAIFDSRYGVYNKRYFLEQIKQEKVRAEKFKQQSSLVLAKVKDNVMGSITDAKDKALLLRIIAKQLLKTSRRSDIVAHYEKGIFVMILKYTDLEHAKKACERISELMKNTNFFLNEREVEVDVEVAISKIATDRTIEETISCGLDALPKSGKFLEPYTVCEKDQ